MNKLGNNILEIIKLPGSLVRITGIGDVSLEDLHTGIFICDPDGDLAFISTDKVIDSDTTTVTGTITKRDNQTARMTSPRKVVWAVNWLY